MQVKLCVMMRGYGLCMMKGRLHFQSESLYLYFSKLLSIDLALQVLYCGGDSCIGVH